MQYQEATLRQISPAALAVLGSMEMAYIREVEEEGMTLYAIYSADGQRLGEEETPEIAMVVARQNDLDAFLVS
ncbi:hypothetical protein GUA87_04665 [Sneathiella sp. P13V-1]|uniref:DUF1150 family protein n=1 Tax=Sneathiella sp. P13V-1 TaxID=2697366 RepID=UPI00187B9580|nr:hypothetical protein [Sneathiella sp. P13V-1]MBE7636125.1 hypothetical protein [Sneathiella sp. P13V-1]